MDILCKFEYELEDNDADYKVCWFISQKSQKILRNFHNFTQLLRFNKLSAKIINKSVPQSHPKAQNTYHSSHHLLPHYFERGKP